MVENDTIDWPDLNESGAQRERTLRRLHAFLLRAAYSEVHRQGAGRPECSGVDTDELAQQAADDALMAILGKIDGFRAQSRFTTWAYSFVIFEVSATLRRHARCQSTMSMRMDTDDCAGLPDRRAVDPADYAAGRGLMSTVRRTADTELSRRQRQVFVAVVVDGVPVDRLSGQLGMSRNAIHQTMFDVRRKLRRALQADGYLC